MSAVVLDDGLHEELDNSVTTTQQGLSFPILVTISAEFCMPPGWCAEGAPGPPTWDEPGNLGHFFLGTAGGSQTTALDFAK